MDIAIYGSGKVAGHLAEAIVRSPHRLSAVLSRNKTRGQALADVVGTAFLTPDALSTQTDFVLVAVSDSALEDVFGLLPKNIPAVHTAGSVALLPHLAGSGVFYPIQTFTTGRKVEMAGIPVLADADNEQLLQKLLSFGQSISVKLQRVDYPTRLACHCAAVLANNFTNHFYALAQEILAGKGLSPDLLSPLILETAAKAVQIGALQGQTGPAARGDMKTMAKHLQLPGLHPETGALYGIISKHIQRRHAPKL